MIQPPQPGPEARPVEVQKQPGRETGELQVSNYLSNVYREQVFDAFHFDDELLVNEQVDLQIVANALFWVENGNTTLSFNKQSIRDEFNDQTVSTDGFE